MRTEELLRPGAPGLVLLDTDAERAWAWALEYREESELGFALRWLRGSRMRTLEGFHDELAAALQFPPHYGHGWDALNDCFNDLEWLEGQGFVFLFLDAEQVLAEAEGGWSLLAELADQAAETWAEMDELPFKLVLQAEGAALDELQTRLARQGVRAEPLQLPMVN